MARLKLRFYADLVTILQQRLVAGSDACSLSEQTSLEGQCRRTILDPGIQDSVYRG